MKVLDKKGKLFGKINIVDLVVILLVVCILAAVIWKVADAKITAAQEAEEESAASFENAPHMVYTVICRSVLPEVAEAITQERPAEDMQIMNGNELVEAFITDCSYEYEVDSDGKQTGTCKVYFTIEAALDETDGIYKVGTQEVRIGKSHIVKTYDLETSGVISAMEVIDE